ncbi:helix-turn-helix domain-containing protein [Streptococcus hyointestinalis]|nr:helix-turn-helix transcriptional regulator [Streptococcus hyointestinalis]
MSSFTTKLKQLRKQKKLTQKEIAEQIGIKQNTYSDWETGRTQPNLDYLSKLAHILDTTTDELLGRQVIDVTDKTEEERKAILYDKLETMYNTFQSMKKSGLDIEKAHQLIDLTGNEPFYHGLLEAVYSDKVDVSLAERIAINFKGKENDLTRLAGINTNSAPKETNDTDKN